MNGCAERREGGQRCHGADARGGGGKQGEGSFRFLSPAPASSCAISSCSGMSCSAASIFCRTVLT